MVGMRSSLVLSILVAAALGACSQSLTTDKTGTGGSGTGGSGWATGGATGGSSSGGGGSGGKVEALCNALPAEYQSALTAAESCQVGASGQCQQLVSGVLSGCGCPIYVTDASALATIENDWQSAGCATTEPPCALLCPAPLNRTCVSTDGGSVGFCSYVPGTGGTSGAGGDGATGGTSGAGGSPADGGLSGCGTLASEYAAVLIGAKSCTAGAAGQCGKSVLTSLSLCSSGCTTFVTDSSVLDSIRTEWDAAGCGNAPIACPLIACLPAASATCVASDAGGSVCSTSYQQVPAN
jgi:hypothetical protein